MLWLLLQFSSHGGGVYLHDVSPVLTHSGERTAALLKRKLDLYAAQALALNLALQLSWARQCRSHCAKKCAPCWAADAQNQRAIMLATGQLWSCNLFPKRGGWWIHCSACMQLCS